MKLKVQGKQIDVGDALRTHVAEALETVTQKYFDNAIDATVVFSREAHLLHADVTVHAGPNIMLQSRGEAGDAYLAFDQAADKMAKRLRRHKRRLRDYDRESAAALAGIPAVYQVFEAPGDDDDEPESAGDAPVVIADMTMNVDSLTVSQAVMRLDLGDRPALLFRNSAHGGLNMVYRRVDGNIGWVDPKDGSSPSG